MNLEIVGDSPASLLSYESQTVSSRTKRLGEAREPSVVVGHVDAEVAALPVGGATPEVWRVFHPI